MVNLLDIFPLTFDEFLDVTDPARISQIQHELIEVYENDFVLQYGTEIIPVEAKGGEDKSAPSFKKYIADHHPEHALRFSKRGYRKDESVTNLPLYLARKTKELL